MEKANSRSAKGSGHPWAADLSCRIDKQIHQNLQETARTIREERMAKSSSTEGSKGPSMEPKREEPSSP
jgi:hypothetical protein